MLSYRHGFHAGNHADVLKHLVLLTLLDHLRQKEKPFVCIDTHSGGGLYQLDSEYARKTGEASGGIMPLWQAWRAGTVQDNALLGYLALVAEFNPQGAADPLCYPGSPAIIRARLRQQDKAQLMELHTTEIALLKQQFGRDPRFSIHHRDGFEGAVAVCPPEPRRGLLLMDPAYEDKSDYARAVKSLLAVHKRWATGVLVLWYPILGRRRDQSAWLKEQLSKTSAPVEIVELKITPQSEEFGMCGSGMLVINPPWQFATNLAPALAELHAKLGLSEG